MRRLTRRQKRKLKRIIGETVSAAAIGVALGGLLIFGFATDSYTPPEPPEHFGQVEYGGIWWEQEDYEAMMAEREEYLAAEQKETAEFAESIKQAQKRYEESQQQEILGYRNAERQSLIGSMDWDAEESYMLAKIAMAEAEGEDTKGKALVILTVLNRVWSDQFPDTIAEVITDSRDNTSLQENLLTLSEQESEITRRTSTSPNLSVTSSTRTPVPMPTLPESENWHLSSTAHSSTEIPRSVRHLSI